MKDLEIEGESSNLASLLIVAGVAAAGVIAGWLSRHLLGDKTLRREFDELKRHLGLNKPTSEDLQ